MTYEARQKESLTLGWRRKFSLLCLLFATAINLRAQNLTTLHSLGCADGSDPAQGLAQGTDGNLYGATESCGTYGYGTIFKMTPNGTLTTLYDFDDTDGYEPSPVVQGSNGALYGTTYLGGANAGCPYGSCGTVFRITPSGTFTTLYNFCSQGGSACTDGDEPYIGLTLGSDGNFYGTTAQGGASGISPGGTVYKITPAGRLTTLYSFCSQGGSNCSDGAQPETLLIQSTDGNFYGATSHGGANSTDGGGTIFKITPGGQLTTLYNFCGQPNCADGTEPYGLVQGADGNFYGTTDTGGASLSCSDGCGTVFKMTPSGALTTLYTFCYGGGACVDGEYPVGVSVGTDGNVYGTSQGGEFGCGAIFEITTATGGFQTLYSFDCTQGIGLPDGDGLTQDTNGKFYGVTAAGGTNGDGTVFSFSVGLGPFVETEPISGKVGATVKILGNNLTGATSVTFNGTPVASFIVAPSVITTAVPSGATTGYVQVTTPHGTLKTNVVFRVKP